VEILLSLVPDYASVLDIGCGSGLFLGLALQYGKAIRAYGIDVSRDALKMAEQMRENGLSREQARRLTLHLSNGIADWPEEKFDMVSLIDMMHHVALDQRQAVFEAAMVRVKPGGILLYKDMCRRPRWRALLNSLHDLVLARLWITYTPISQVESAAEQFGLIESRSETINRLWYGHELRVYQRAAAKVAEAALATAIVP
jgi:2-polyprenyl-3-methyl-5-hydroxy-6-metoxy-1,4-benzoquinol methylase